MALLPDNADGKGGLYVQAPMGKPFIRMEEPHHGEQLAQSA
jgi:hypothetical protein